MNNDNFTTGLKTTFANVQTKTWTPFLNKKSVLQTNLYFPPGMKERIYMPESSRNKNPISEFLHYPIPKRDVSISIILILVIHGYTTCTVSTKICIIYNKHYSYTTKKKRENAISTFEIATKVITQNFRF